LQSPAADVSGLRSRCNRHSETTLLLDVHLYMRACWSRLVLIIRNKQPWTPSHTASYVTSICIY